MTGGEPPSTCPVCRARIVRRVFGFWCPRCRGWLTLYRSTRYQGENGTPMVWGIRGEY